MQTSVAQGRGGGSKRFHKKGMGWPYLTSIAKNYSLCNCLLKQPNGRGLLESTIDGQLNDAAQHFDPRFHGIGTHNLLKMSCHP